MNNKQFVNAISKLHSISAKKLGELTEDEKMALSYFLIHNAWKRPKMFPVEHKMESVTDAKSLKWTAFEKNPFVWICDGCKDPDTFAQAGYQGVYPISEKDIPVVIPFKNKCGHWLCAGCMHRMCSNRVIIVGHIKPKMRDIQSMVDDDQYGLGSKILKNIDTGTYNRSELLMEYVADELVGNIDRVSEWPHGTIFVVADMLNPMVEYKCPVCQHVEDPQVNGWGVEGVALFTDLKVAMEFAK
jgi:hypothetical protein